MEGLKELFIIKVPKLGSNTRHTELVLPHYEFYTLLVEDYRMALDEGQKIITDKGIHAVILCAGFTNEEVGDITKAFGDKVGVLVARGDGRSSAIVDKAIENAGW